jgi:hypothetical protein
VWRTFRDASHVTAHVVEVAKVSDDRVTGTDRVPQMRPDLFLAADRVRLAARQQCQRESEREWEDVHGDSFQLWP